MKITRLSHAMAVAALVATAATAPAFAESSNSQTFEGWANETATANNGRISRDVYMNEMGRRWDADTRHTGTRDAYMGDLGTRWERADTEKRGLTPVEISRMTGKVDSSTAGVPKTGSGVQPGNMGPSSSKGQ